MSVNIKTGAWLDEQVFAPLQWAVPGIIPEGFGLLVGPPKLGKSWFVLNALLNVAEGGRALGVIPTQSRPVLYAALEDGDRRMQQRARHITAGQPLPKRFSYFTEAESAGEVLDTINAWLDANRGGMVALDTLGRVLPTTGQNQTQYERDYRIGATLKQIADTHPGSALVVVHHARKAFAADFMDATSGTNGLNGAADYTIVLERPRGEDKALIRISGRDVEEGTYAAQMPQGIWTLDGNNLNEAARRAATNEVSQGLGDDSTELLNLIGQNPDGIKAAEVAEQMGWDNGKTRMYLKRLCDTGRITRASRGTYTPVTSVTSVTSTDPYPPVTSVTSVTYPQPDVTQVTEVTHPHQDNNQQSESFFGEGLDLGVRSHVRARRP
ncbi:MAG: AAA family ATPase [Scrofimicrobium sp.]